MLKIMLVDDHPIVRAGLAAVLSQDPDRTICALCSTADEALAAAKQEPEPADLAVIDLTLGDSSALPLISTLAYLHPAMRLLVVSIHDENIFALRAIEAGAHGYLMKGAPIEQLESAVQTVMAGRTYLSERLRNRLVDERLQGAEAATGGIGTLTRAELVVLHMMGAGSTTREIATSLSRSIKTIEVHKSNIKHKLGIANNHALLRFAMQCAQPQLPQSA